MQLWSCLVCLLLLQLRLSFGQNDIQRQYDKTAANLTAELFKTYTYMVRPCGKAPPGYEETTTTRGFQRYPTTTEPPKDVCHPLEVDVNVKILSIMDIDDDNMELKMQILLRQEWTDKRLQYSSESGTDELIIDVSEHRYRIWSPDTFFNREKEANKHMIDQPNNQYRISPSGTVFYSTRISITLSCPMNLRRFPFDVQTCYMQFGSYAQTTENLIYKWKEHSSVELAGDVRDTTPVFALGDVQRTECANVLATGSYSCLKLEIQFIRQFGFADFMKYFVPSFVLVVLSWLAFYMKIDDILVRVLIGLTCLQFLLIHWSMLAGDMPHVGSYRAIDVWLVVCLLFIGMTLFELLLVLRYRGCRRTVGDMELAVIQRPTEDVKYARVRTASEMDGLPKTSVGKPTRKYTRLMSRDGTRTGPGNISHDLQLQTLILPTSQYYEEPVAPQKPLNSWGRFQRLSTSEKIDIVSRYLFPLVFFIFNIGYWWYY